MSEDIEDLREMVPEEEIEAEESGIRFPSFLLELESWQRLVLAVLLFLNVALCGCLALVMAGRVMPPF